MKLTVFRAGVPIAVPDDYASDPTHQILVSKLEQTNQYADAVALLEQHPESYLAADVLSGAPWARRYLNSTALLSRSGDRMAQRGLRALLSVLNGAKKRVGRRREPPLTPEQIGKVTEALARWRAVTDAIWHHERAALGGAIIASAVLRMPLSLAHRRAIRSMVRRPRLRRHDVVLALTSWETGVPIRRLRSTPQPADLIYG